MKKGIFLVLLLALVAFTTRAHAQYTTTSVTTNSDLQLQIASAQIQAITLIGQEVAQLSIQAAPYVDTATLRNLQLAWVGLAQSEISWVRLKYNV